MPEIKQGRRLRRRPDGPRDRAGRRPGGLRRRPARGRRRRARQGRRADREAARARRSRRAGWTQADADAVSGPHPRHDRLRRPRRLRPRHRGDHRAPARRSSRCGRELDAIVKPEALFATNTSSLPVIDQAAVTSRPDRFLGLHFFNPAQVMKLARGRPLRDHERRDVRGRPRLRRGGSASTTVQTRDTRRLHRQPPARARTCSTRSAPTRRASARSRRSTTAMKAGAGHPMGPLHARRLRRPRHDGRDLRRRCSTSSASAASPARRCCARCSPPAGTARSPASGFYDYAGDTPVPNAGI